MVLGGTNLTNIAPYFLKQIHQFTSLDTSHIHLNAKHAYQQTWIYIYTHTVLQNNNVIPAFIKSYILSYILTCLQTYNTILRHCLCSRNGHSGQYGQNIRWNRCMPTTWVRKASLFLWILKCPVGDAVSLHWMPLNHHIFSNYIYSPYVCLFNIVEL